MIFLLCFFMSFALYAYPVIPEQAKNAAYITPAFDPFSFFSGDFLLKINF